MVKCVFMIKSGWIFYCYSHVPAGVEMDGSFRHASFQIFAALQFSGM